MAKPAPAKTLRKALTALGRKYGRQRQRSTRPAFDETMLAVLEDGTSRAKAEEGLATLTREFVDWNEVRVSSVRELGEVLKPVGGDLVAKAKLIRAILGDLFATLHDINMDHVDRMKPKEVRDHFARIPDVPSRVVEQVVLYCAGGSGLPVPTDAVRVSKRLGIIDFNLEGTEAENALAALVPKSRAYSFVELYRSHAEETCTLRRPKCTSCMLRAFCPKIITAALAKAQEAERTKKKRPAAKKPKSKKRPAAKSKAKKRAAAKKARSR
jgi:endonuclease-3